MNRASQPASFWSRNARTILGLALLVLMIHDIFGAHGFLAMRRTQEEMRQIRVNLDRLNHENTELAGQINSLKTDPKTIERIAREEMGLARPGELIIKLPPPAENSHDAPDANVTH